MSRIFHVALAAEWRAAAADGWYRTSTRGASLEQVGFVHCSTAEQVPVVGTRFYGDVEDELVVLEIDPAAVGAEVRFEDLEGSGHDFPHVYGPIPVAAVVAVHPVVGRDAAAFSVA